MERTFFETVHFLGLDLELATVAVMAALESLRRLVEYLRAEHQSQSTQTGRLPPRQPVAWPPEGWRANH
jgi:hypothetical protein